MKSLSKTAILKIIRDEMPTLRQRFGVEDLALFGSFARDKASENSDIDLVVSLAKPLGFAFVELADYLEEKLGCKVDLITSATLEMGIADPRRAHIAKDIQESLVHA
jgi:predicted nucleotidyltransferase